MSYNVGFIRNIIKDLPDDAQLVIWTDETDEDGLQGGQAFDPSDVFVTKDTQPIALHITIKLD